MTDDECIHLMRPDECTICRPKPARQLRPPRHHWDAIDDAACVGAWYRYSGRVPAYVAAELAELIGTTEASVVLRIANVDAALGTGKMTSVASATRTIAERYADLTQDERRSVYEEALERLRARKAER